MKVNYDAKYKKALETVKANYATFEVPYYGLDNNDYVNGLGFCCNPAGETTGSLTGKMTAKNGNAELQQFYYHPDHLGSSSYISNLDGEVVQHIEYVPFGEVFLEEKNAKWNTPYLFNSKELDRETGLYYYGARYYDPKTSIWASVDPLAVYNPIMEEEFYYDGDHNGGASNSKNLNTYGYCYQNPVALIDPTGKQVYFMTPPTERISATQASMSVDLIPVLGDAKGIIEAIIGYDFVGNKLSWNDRFLSILLMSELKDAKNTIEVIKDVRKVERVTVKSADEARKIKSARNKAVRDAWKQEKILIENGAVGTRKWTRAELKKLKETGKVKGMRGHHINNVKHHPEQAGNPDNIEFLTQKEHLNAHDGNFRNETTGELKNRK